MSNTQDNDLEQITEGAADWDSSLNANFGILERGYHTRARAGTALNSGYVAWLDPNGFMQPFNPNSAAIRPTAISPFAPSSGDEVLFLLSGIVRSLDARTPGVDYFVSAATPGMVVTSYSAADRKIGYGVAGGGLYFNPRQSALPEQLTRVTTITINPASEHLFSVDVGKSGVVRDLLLKSNSMDKIGLYFYSNSARDNLLYATKSGGVTTVASFTDRALWPYDNTDASTLSGLIYGRVFADSGASVASLALQIALTVDRVR